MSFATDWMLSEIRQTWETRADPSNSALMQYREHMTVTRYKVSDDSWTEETGAQTTSPIAYYVGSISRNASPIASSKWVCTDDSAAEMDPGMNWRRISQTWECWGNWAALTGVFP